MKWKRASDIATIFEHPQELQILNLADQGLEKLPREIGSCKNLKILLLQGNRLRSLPGEIAQLKSLRVLDLRYNYFQEIPESVFELTRLLRLGLSHNEIRILPARLAALTRLQYLFASYNEIALLPETLAELDHLRTLVLAQNQLLQAPQLEGMRLRKLVLSGNRLSPAETVTIRQHWHGLAEKKLAHQEKSILISLEELQNTSPYDVFGVKLTAMVNAPLPQKILSCPNLRYLSLEGFQIPEIPHNFYPLQKLQYLSLHACSIEKLHSDIGKLQNLTHLDLSGNQIKTLPDEIGSLQNLEHLDISKNELSQLPNSVGQLRFLLTLDLTENKISTLPDSIGTVPYLRRIFLNDNPLQRLPQKILWGSKSIEQTMQWQGTQLEQTTFAYYLQQTGDRHSILRGFKEWKNLEAALQYPDEVYSLKLEDQHLNIFPEEIFSFPRLLVLNINRNRIAILPEKIRRLKNLLVLKISHNPITELPDALGSLGRLQALIAKDCQISSISPEISTLKNLIYLDLSENKIQFLPGGNLFWPNLTKLFLAKNKLNDLPDSLQTLQKLHTIDLSGNKFAEWPEIINSLENLDTLLLNANPINQVPATIAELQSLRTLSLASCLLADLPKQFGKLHGLQQLNLVHNEFSHTPEALLALWRLTSLELMHNEISTLPPSINNLTYLSNLNISSNPIVSLPQEITELKLLQILNLSDTWLEELPDRISSMKSLRELNVSFCPITKFPSDFSQCISLQMVDISDTRLSADQIQEIKDQQPRIQFKGLLFEDFSAIELAQSPDTDLWQTTSDFVEAMAADGEEIDPDPKEKPTNILAESDIASDSAAIELEIVEPNSDSAIDIIAEELPLAEPSDSLSNNCYQIVQHRGKNDFPILLVRQDTPELPILCPDCWLRFDIRLSHDQIRDILFRCRNHHYLIARKDSKDFFFLPDLDFLNSVSLLKGVDISGCGMADLSPLTRYPSLEQLVARNQFANLETDQNLFVDLQGIQGMQLKRLDLAGNPLKNLSTISLDKLEEIDISDCSLPKIESLDFLSSSRALKSLSLSQTPPLSMKSISAIGKIKTLERLTLGVVQANHSAAFSGLTNLIEFHADEFRGNSLKWIGKFTRIDTVHLGKAANLRDISVLKNIPHLHHLALNLAKASSWTHLAASRELTYLSLQGSSFSDKQLPLLAELRWLQYLNISGTKIGRLDKLPKLAFLRHLFLDHLSVPDISCLAGRRLEQLSMNGYRRTELPRGWKEIAAETVFLKETSLHPDQIRLVCDHLESKGSHVVTDNLE